MALERVSVGRARDRRARRGLGVLMVLAVLLYVLRSGCVLCGGGIVGRRRLCVVDEGL